MSEAGRLAANPKIIAAGRVCRWLPAEQPLERGIAIRKTVNGERVVWRGPSWVRKAGWSVGAQLQGLLGTDLINQRVRLEESECLRILG